MTWLITAVLAGTLFSAEPLIWVNSEAPKPALTANVRATDEIEESESSYPINLNGRIEVSNINGPIDVTGWDRPEVKLYTKKVANTKERLEDLEIEITSNADNFRVGVDYKNKKGKWSSGDKLYVEFRLMVPKTALVNELGSVNGSVNVRSLTNMTVVSSVNGAVRATELSGKVKLSTVNGSIRADFVEVRPDMEISLGTVNGSVEAMVPSNVDVTVKADSLNGSITNDFGLPVKKGKYVGRSLYGRIGSGLTKINLNSVNGSISLKRIADGLAPNPVENLLPQKTSDDFDAAFDGEMSAVSTTLPKLAIEARKAAEEARIVAMEAALETKAATELIARQTDLSKLATEATVASLASIDAVQIDSKRIEAELARMSETMFGARPVPFIVEDSKTVSVADNPMVNVDAMRCNVTVRGWDRNEVKYRVTRMARGRTTPVKDVAFSSDKDGVDLRVFVTDDVAGADQILEQVNVEVFVPSKSNLQIKTDREIRLEGVNGKIDLVGKNGGIDIRESKGELTVETKSGAVRIIGFAGKLNSTNYKGDTYLEGDFSQIVTRSFGGKVYLSLRSDAGVTIRTIENGPAERNRESLEFTDGFRMDRKSNNTWVLGNGRSDYKFEMNGGGRLFVREALISE